MKNKLRKNAVGQNTFNSSFQNLRPQTSGNQPKILYNQSIISCNETLPCSQLQCFLQIKLNFNNGHEKQRPHTLKVHKSPSSNQMGASLNWICDRFGPMAARIKPNIMRSKNWRFQRGPRSKHSTFRCLPKAWSGVIWSEELKM